MYQSLSRRIGQQTFATQQNVLNYLNYTFSKDCAEKESYGFFLGGFYATEEMSAKRCGQILNGLLRLGIPKSELKYLEINAVHFFA